MQIKALNETRRQSAGYQFSKASAPWTAPTQLTGMYSQRFWKLIPGALPPAGHLNGYHWI